MYDYGARFYMPDIGRWGVVDPFAEKAPSWTPYRYSFNSPINYLDPTGLFETRFGAWWHRLWHGGGGKIQYDKKNEEYYYNKSGATLASNGNKGNNIDLITHREFGRQINSSSNSVATASAIAIPIGQTSVGSGTAAGTATGTATVAGLSASTIFFSALAILTLNGDTPVDDTKKPPKLVLYRGVYVGHPDYQNALKGIAVPRGGNATPEEHNNGDNNSIYTSWSFWPQVADKFGGRKGPGGVVLTKTFEWNEVVPSLDKFGQGEVLVPGIVTGAIVTPATPNPKK